MRRKPASATSKTYELQMKIFYGQPEELIALLKNFKKVANRTGTTAVSRWIKYLWTTICVEALQDFDEQVSQNNVTTYAYLKAIQ